MTKFKLSLSFEFNPADFFLEIRRVFLFGTRSLRVKENCRVTLALQLLATVVLVQPWLKI